MCGRRGGGQPVVLIHGASGNLRDWTFRIADRLARTHHVIAFDRPGHGYSDRLPDRGWDPGHQAAQLRSAVAQMTDTPPIIVGHSWGAALAMAWALDGPTRGVITLAGATMPWGGALSAHYSFLASEFTGPALARLVSAMATDRRARAAVADIFAPQEVPEGYVDYIGVPLATRPETLRRNAQDVVNLENILRDQARRYDTLQTPVQILHGRRPIQSCLPRSMRTACTPGSPTAS